jgi:hypothetical protein
VDCERGSLGRIVLGPNSVRMLKDFSCAILRVSLWSNNCSSFSKIDCEKLSRSLGLSLVLQGYEDSLLDVSWGDYDAKI